MPPHRLPPSNGGHEAAFAFSLIGPMPSQTKTIAFSLILLIFVLAFFELSAGVITWLLVRRSWMAAIPSFTAAEVSTYFQERNPVLGWGPRVGPDGTVVELTPRHDPARTLPDTPCASAYGDSFTLGSEVGDSAAIPSRLTQIFGCPVANYGVGGFGSDQATMLFHAQRDLDHAPVVILGHISENLLRNINQYRNLLYPGQEYFFKPRFKLSGDAVAVVPIPVQRPTDFQELRRRPAQVLPLDAFLERPRRTFPYTVALIRWGLFDYHVRAALAGRPRHEKFYRPDDPNRGVELTVAIGERFVQQARAQGRMPVVLLMPVGSDLTNAKETGEWIDQPLADGLRRRGVPVIHAGPAMLGRLAGEDPCRLFTHCNAHYNERGYLMVAEIVAEALREIAPELARGAPGKSPARGAPLPSGGAP